jgi:hypothetical protein
LDRQFNAGRVATELYYAMQEVGIEEDRVFEALADLPANQRQELRERFEQMYPGTLDEWVDGDFSDVGTVARHKLVNDILGTGGEVVLTQAMRVNKAPSIGRSTLFALHTPLTACGDTGRLLG